MAWDFSTEPEFQEKLDWIREFVATEIEPLDLAFNSHLVYDKSHPVHEKVIRPLQEQVKEQGLWACHLGPDLGGLGYGQLKLGLMNEILGRSQLGAVGVRLPGARLRQRGDHRPLRHRGAEGEVPRAVARAAHGVVLLDDRAAGRLRPRASSSAAPGRTATSG